MSDEDIFNGYGIKVELVADFNKVKEVLTRIGIANFKNKTLTQSCHIFHKRGQYAIMHFLEMLQFDGRTANFTVTDEGRRNKIAEILEEWGLVKIVDDLTEEDPKADLSAFTVLTRKRIQDEGWTQVKKYTIGKK